MGGGGWRRGGGSGLKGGGERGGRRLERRGPQRAAWQSPDTLHVLRLTRTRADGPTAGRGGTVRPASFILVPPASWDVSPASVGRFRRGC